MFKLIDTHAHVEFKAYGDEADLVMRRALDAGMTIINVGTQIDTSKAAVAMIEKYPEHVYAAVGLHPDHTWKHIMDEEDIRFVTREEEFNYEAYKQLALNPKVVAIGECGLDYYRFEGLEDAVIQKIKAKQKEVFLQHIELAIELDKVLMVHCRPSKGTMDAYTDVLSILNSKFEILNSELRFEIHCYTGDLEHALKFVELGGYIALNGIATFDKTGVTTRVATELPLEHIILETDCPYLAPAPFRGKRNEPIYTEYTAKKIAELKGISFEEVAKVTTSNAITLFNL